MALLTSLLCMWACQEAARAAPVYVNHSATGLNNGTSWENAYQSLSAALKSGTTNELWVAAGTYLPGYFATDSFDVRGHRIFGGFAGTETTREARNPGVNVTTLSGKLLDDGSLYAIHVITKTTSMPAVLDGVVVRDGRSITGSLDTGAGLYATAGSLSISGCVFTNNRARSNGGAIWFAGEGISVSNSTFGGNANVVFGSMGGAICVASYTAGAEFDGVEFRDNRSVFSAADLYVTNAPGSNAPVRIANVRSIGALAGRRGGSMLLSAGSGPVTIENSQFERAAISLEDQAGTAVASTGRGVHLLRNVAVRGIVARGDGGGVYLEQPLSATVEDCIFEDIDAPGNKTGSGGGLYCGSGSAVLRNSVFRRILRSGSANRRGAAAAFGGTGSDSFLATGCSFEDVDNLSGGAGALSVSGFGTSVITNVVFRRITSTGSGGAAIVAVSSASHVLDCVFTNIVVNDDSDGVSGGALYLGGGTRTTIRDCEISDVRLFDAPNNHGGALYISQSSGSVLVSNCVIRGITKPNNGKGGGIYVAGVSSFQMVDSRLERVVGSVGQGGALYLSGGTVVVRGSTIRDVKGSGNGGVIYAGSTSSLTLRDSRISECHNVGGFDAGGIITMSGRLFVLGSTIERCTALNNETPPPKCNGGLIYISAGGSVVVSNSVFDRIQTRLPRGFDTHHGGLLYVDDYPSFPKSPSRIVDSQFLNSTNECSGNIYLSPIDYAGVGLFVSNCVFRGLMATQNGSAMHIYTLFTETVIADSRFEDCISATELVNGVYGGTIYQYNGTTSAGRPATFLRNVFRRNRSRSGGAIYCREGMSGSTFVNNVFAGNVANTGGALNMGGSSGVTFLHCSFAANEATSGPAFVSGSYTFINSVLRWNVAYGGGREGEGGSQSFTDCFTGGGASFNGTFTRNRTEDPLFRNLTALDLRPVFNSPLIDAVPVVSPTSSPDLLGVARPQGAGVDVGAYEFSAADIVRDVEVYGAGIAITNGSATPEALNNTDFGEIAATRGADRRTFVISNLGNADIHLTGDPPVAIAGANAGDFRVVAQPDTVISALSGSSPFTIEFDPSAVGVRSAEVQIGTDVPGDETYRFAIGGRGVPAAPNVSLTGNGGVVITNHDMVVSAIDHTDFGTLTFGQTVTRTFTIQNGGESPLVLTGTPRVQFTGPTNYFSVVAQPSSPLAVGATTTFQVKLNPRGTSASFNDTTFAAVVRIDNNGDSLNNPFEFKVSGFVRAKRLTVLTNPPEGATAEGGPYTNFGVMEGSNKVVNLVMTAGYGFGLWEGDLQDCTVQGSRLVCPMTRDRTVTALLQMTDVNLGGGSAAGEYRLVVLREDSLVNDLNNAGQSVGIDRATGHGYMWDKDGRVLKQVPQSVDPNIAINEAGDLACGWGGAVFHIPAASSNEYALVAEGRPAWTAPELAWSAPWQVYDLEGDIVGAGGYVPVPADTEKRYPVAWRRKAGWPPEALFAALPVHDATGWTAANHVEGVYSVNALGWMVGGASDNTPREGFIEEAAVWVPGVDFGQAGHTNAGYCLQRLPTPEYLSIPQNRPLRMFPYSINNGVAEDGSNVWAVGWINQGQYGPVYWRTTDAGSANAGENWIVNTAPLNFSGGRDWPAAHPTIPLDVNNRGLVVGYSTASVSGDLGQEVMLDAASARQSTSALVRYGLSLQYGVGWVRDSMITDSGYHELDPLIAQVSPGYGTPGEWDVVQPKAVNDDGVIAANARYQGQMYAVLLIPQPALEIEVRGGVTEDVANITARGGVHSGEGSEGVVIQDGDVRPSVTKGSDFGALDPVLNSPVRTFAVVNRGNRSFLSLNGSPPVLLSGENAADFVVESQPSSSIGPGERSLFRIRYRPQRPVATSTAFVEIRSDDPDEQRYEFLIRASMTGQSNGSILLVR